MEQIYQLKDGVYFSAGVLRGALLDTNTGMVYSINRQACQVIKYELDDPPFWTSLVGLSLAEPVDCPRIAELPALSSPALLKFTWFEVVTDDCNERCLHCYAGSMPRIDRTSERKQNGLGTAPEPRQRMTFSDWTSAIAESYHLGCRACQFIGGEPFLYRGEHGETLQDLIIAASQAGFTDIEVFTNGVLLNQQRLQTLKEYGVRAAVSLYSDDACVHDTITQTPGSHAKTVAALKALKEMGIKTRVETVVTKTNQKTLESTIAYRKQLGHSGKMPAPLWPSGRGSDIQNRPDTPILVKYGFKLIPDFKADKDTIAHYRSGNACLLGKAVITEYGDVLPCIFSRKQVLGNYLETGDLVGILQQPDCQRIWHATKDQVFVCKDCEYRYVCFDCRPLAEAESQGNADFFCSPSPRCTYTPYTGEWGDGIWKVNDAGEPVYSRKHALAIRKGRKILLRAQE